MKKNFRITTAPPEAFLKFKELAKVAKKENYSGEKVKWMEAMIQLYNMPVIFHDQITHNKLTAKQIVKKISINTVTRNCQPTIKNVADFLENNLADEEILKKHRESILSLFFPIYSGDIILKGNIPFSRKKYIDALARLEECDEKSRYSICLCKIYKELLLEQFVTKIDKAPLSSAEKIYVPELKRIFYSFILEPDNYYEHHDKNLGKLLIPKNTKQFIENLGEFVKIAITPTASKK